MNQKYDIIMRHNASNKTWIFSQQENTSLSDMYLEFDDFSFPEDAPSGEYTVYAIWNIREPNDVTYTLTSDILRSKVNVGGETFTIADVRPLINLCQYDMTAERNELYLNNKKSNELLYL